MSSLRYTVCTDGVLVGGNTYGVREVLKAVGGRWLSDSKEWLVAGAQIQAVRDRVEEVLAQAAALRKEELAAVRAKRVWEASPEGRRKRVDEALAAGTHTWICCKHCDVLDWTRKTSDCSVHGFRLRGCTWNGT
jgi:hypothetical protein